MKLNKWKFIVSIGVALTGNAYALTPQFEQMQMPRCLADNLPKTYEVLAENKEFKIVNVPFNALNQLNLLADKVKCGRFVNVSDELAKASSPKMAAVKLLQKPALKPARLSKKYEIQHEEAVNKAIAQVESPNIWDTLTHLTSFYNRSATQKTGVEAAEWLRAEFLSLVVKSGRTDVETYFVDTGKYIQPSLVTVIGKDIKAPGIVIGAHMDTLDGRMPGAGDDGSGSSSVMEVARILLSSDLTFKRPVYIIWYSAEERGLVGSKHVVQHFVKNAIPVKAAIQFDMTGFRNDPLDETMWVYRDYTDKSLSDFVAKLITHFVKVPVDYSKCGYGCSDHASWTAIGVPAAFPCETDFENHNQNIHTSADTMDTLSLEHMTNFTKLGLAFAIELATE